MYQPPRPSATRAATTSSASSPRTNPYRSNHDRDEMAERRRSQDPSAALERGVGDGASGVGEAPTYDEEVKYMKNLNSIVQQFFIKGALTLVGSRVPLPPARQRDSDEVRNNRWFNLVLPESDALAEFTSEWRGIDVGQERPPPMVIEIYLDLAELTRSQKLIILDDDGKRWDVAEALNPSFSASSTRPESRTGVSTQVLLERWVISLSGSPSDSAMRLDSLSSVYKRGIPLFRSLYTFGRTMPAFRYSRRLLKQPPNQPSVKLNYRILNGQFKSPHRDTLEIPLAKSEDEVTENYSFEPLQCSAGTLNMSVSYRSNCDFRVDDTESLMSSHFMASDDNYFKPSLPGRQKEPTHVPSSVPNARHEYHPEMVEQGQVYGSLSTFHKTGATLGSSPLSAIRANRDGQSPDTPPLRPPPTQRLSVGSRSSLRSETAPSNPRRQSVSFQPFKAGSLASSPNVNVPPSPGTSFGRTGPSSLTHTRNRPSLTTLPQQVLRTPNLPNETAIASSASSSPKPAPISRYSSSFSHRRSRFSSTGSKGDDDQNSSGKQSASSSAQRGSDLINESQRSSSESMEQTEDDKSIQDFIHLLESKKDLKSFRTDSATRDVAMKRTTAALSKYRGMRDSNIALSDSMSSSLLLHRSSSSSSRQLSSVPPMIHGTSVSTSSSPGKPISPHTPHTPAIPSRLSDNLTIHYGNEARRSRSRSQRRRQSAEQPREDDSSDTTTHDTATTAIDIPTSPRAWPYVRRSSSVSQQQRALDDEPDLSYGIRSASLPADERTELSMSELLRVNIDQSSTAEPPEDDRSPNEGTEEIGAFPFPEPEADQPAQQQHFRNRLARGYRRGSPSFSSERGGSRYSAGSSRLGEEEELIFHLSELGSASRRSLEEGRGGAGGSRSGRSGPGGWGYSDTPPPSQR